jgi:Porin subfamily
MRKSFLVIAALMLSAAGAPAQQGGIQKPERTTPPAKMLPAKPATSANSCAAYGTGFVKLEGSDTCVKVGGAVSVDVGTSRGGR